MDEWTIPLPGYMQVEPVGQCNLRCQMCPILFRKDGPPYGPPAFMNFEVYTRLLEQFHTLKELHLQGLGEPMMHPRFFDMVSAATSRGIKTTTNSNLTLLNAGRADRCVTSGLDTIFVSIDGASAAMYEEIRVRSKLDRVLRNVGLVREAKKKLGSAAPHLRMVSVIMRQNLHELPDLVRLAHRLEMESLFVQHLAHDFGEESLPEEYKPMREFVDAQTLVLEDQGRVEHYFGAARKEALALQLDLRLPSTRARLHPPGTPGPERCNWPWTGAYISYQGYAMPCCMIATPDRMTMGDMAKDGAEAVWNGETYREFRRKLASETPPAVCASCAIYHGTF